MSSRRDGKALRRRGNPIGRRRERSPRDVVSAPRRGKHSPRCRMRSCGGQMRSRRQVERFARGGKRSTRSQDDSPRRGNLSRPRRNNFPRAPKSSRRVRDRLPSRGRRTCRRVKCRRRGGGYSSRWVRRFCRGVEHWLRRGKRPRRRSSRSARVAGHFPAWRARVVPRTCANRPSDVDSSPLTRGKRGASEP
jgi:hypothetical protein